MRLIFGALCAALSALCATHAGAAEKWGMPHEKELIVRGKVVDILCELARDCPPDCGGGKRQLGLVTAEGVLRPAAKGNVDFASPVIDLAPFCGKTIFADGLLLENPAAHLYFVQAIRERDGDPWIPATAFQTRFDARHGATKEWYRSDPTAKDIIARDGVLGVPGLAPPPKKQ
jgi:hypothetical protein